MSVYPIGVRRGHGSRLLSAIRHAARVRAYGPNGAQVVALIDAISELKVRDFEAPPQRYYDAMWGANNALWTAAHESGRKPALDAAIQSVFAAIARAQLGASSDQLRFFAAGAAGALVARDLIAAKDFETLTWAWCQIADPVWEDA
jgi:hypothetical protein